MQCDLISLIADRYLAVIVNTNQTVKTNLLEGRRYKLCIVGFLMPSLADNGNACIVSIESSFNRLSQGVILSGIMHPVGAGPALLNR